MPLDRKYLLTLLVLLFITLPVAGSPADVPVVEDIAFFLHEGVEILDFAGPLEVFAVAGFNVYTCSLTKEPITSQGVLRVLPDHGIEDCPQPDMVAFFGGGWASQVAEKPAVKAWVERVAAKTELDFSVCTGAFFLGQAGLLDGRQATTYHMAISQLAQKFPEAQVLEGVRFVDNGEVITTAGISAGIDGALHIVSKVKGPQLARWVAEAMEYDKWIADEGRILPTPFSEAVAADGLEPTLARLQAGELPFPFKGELIELALEELAQGSPVAAKRTLRLVIDQFEPNRFDFANLGNAMRATGEQAPPAEDLVLAWARAGLTEPIRQAISDLRNYSSGWTLYSQGQMNMIGYDHLTSGDAATAVEIFRVNVLAFPDSAYAHDSLGEGLAELGRREEAVASYRRALDLEPSLETARAQLDRLLAEGGAGTTVGAE